MFTDFAKKLIPEKLRHEHRFANGYLAPKGWHQSAETRLSTDQHGPVPWISYPARAMIERVVTPDYKVFEYGSGNSSLWWAKRVSEIVSVENHPEWAADVASRAPSNLKIISKPIHSAITDAQRDILEEFFASEIAPVRLWDVAATLWHGLLTKEFSGYAAELLNYPKGYFDVVVVDGMARVLTAWLAARYVKPSGFVVFDNSDRPQYNAGYAALVAQGFKRIDFYGPGPVNYVEGCTSIFARQFDWLSVNTTLPVDQDCDINREAMKQLSI